MTNTETATSLRDYVKGVRGIWSWPTDSCGYEQHIKFVIHRNKNWQGGTREEFNQFIIDYADSLEKE